MPESQPAALQSRRGRFHLTRLRVLFGLLAVEGCLLLLGRFRWFGLMRVRGEGEMQAFTFLIGLASLVLAGLLCLVWLLVRLGLRRRFQYSLRSALLLVLLASIGMSWIAAKRQWSRRQREAAAAIERFGGDVRWDWCRPREGGFFSKATNASFKDVHVTDNGLRPLNDLTRLLWLEFKGSDIGDSGLRHVKDLKRLRWLDLEATQVTDAGLAHLHGLRQLEGLSLNDTDVTDEGLRHLVALRQLDSLYLRGAGITDSGAKHLQGFRALRWLDLSNTEVTDEGVKRLRQALPRCDITQ